MNDRVTHGIGASHSLGVLIGLSFPKVTRLADRAGRPRIGGLVALLDDVSQFVGEQPHPRLGIRLIPALPHHDMPPEREGLRVDRAGRLRRPGIGVYSNVREVVTEPALHLGPGRGVQSLTRSAQDTCHDRGDSGRAARTVAETMDLLCLIVVAGTWRALDTTATLDLPGFRSRPQR